MRYHWGLGVGHWHSHQPPKKSLDPIIESQSEEARATEHEPAETDSTSRGDELGPVDDGASDAYASDDPELMIEDRDAEGWDDAETDAADSDDAAGDVETEEDDDEDAMFDA